MALGIPTNSPSNSFVSIPKFSSESFFLAKIPIPLSSVSLNSIQLCKSLLKFNYKMKWYLLFQSCKLPCCSSQPTLIRTRFEAFPQVRSTMFQEGIQILFFLSEEVLHIKPPTIYLKGNYGVPPFRFVFCIMNCLRFFRFCLVKTRHSLGTNLLL
jgi:hypothetical protein